MNNQLIVTISRQFGSSGHQIAEILAKELHMPLFDKDDIAQAAKDLKAKTYLTVHHSKYALAKHRWDEPLRNAENMRDIDSLNVLVPEIGEKIELK